MSKNNEYNQRPEESLDDWKYRIIFDKIDKKIDMSWAEICTYLGLSCSGEHLRKIAYGIREYAKYLENKEEVSRGASRSGTRFSELEEKEMNLAREKMRMQDQKRELRKMLREWARAEHIQDEIKKAIDAAGKLPSLHTKMPKKIKSGRDGVLLLSDWHVGQYCSNIENTFNDKVFLDRISELTEKTIKYGRMHRIEKLHTFCLGDFINGLIHVTTRINNTENVIKQSMLAAETLAKMVGRLSEEFPDVDLYFVRGNHDRVSANKKESIAGESFFDLIPWYLKARMEGIKNVKFHENEIDEEIICADVRGKKCFGVHGHRDKMDKAVQNLALLTKFIPDYVFMGHYHHAQEEDIDGTDVIVNGSLCGTDEYAMNLRRTANVSQKFMIFDDTGRICTYDVKVR